MRDIVAMLDRIADGLEKAGLVKEAFEVDCISDSLEAAAQNPMEQTEVSQIKPMMPPIVQKGVPRKTTISPETNTAAPRAGNIIMQNRDSFETQLNAINSALEAVDGLVKMMSAEASKVYPARENNINKNAIRSKQQFSELYQKVREGILQELKNFLFVAGGMEEASQFSIDHLRLAAKKVVDKTT